MKKEYTSEQMNLWGQFSLSLGFAVMVFLLMVMEGLNMYLPIPYKLVVSLLLGLVTYLYYKQYKATKENEKE